MDEHRSGAWREAAATAEAAAARDDATDQERAEAFYLLAAARAKLGDRDAAKVAVARYDGISPRLAKGSWVIAEMNRLRADHGLGDAPAADPADEPITDLGTAFWTVRYRSSMADYAGAARLAGRLLAREDLPPDARCDVLLHLAHARVKLGDAAAADEAFGAFARTAARLPADDPLRLEMSLLRAALGLPALEGLELPAGGFTPPAADDYWTLASPADAGVDPSALDRLASGCAATGADALLVARRGRIVLEWYSPLYREPMMTMSACKSITGLLAGILVHEGKVALDDPLGKYLPAWREGRRGEITLRHLLTMTSGLTHRPSVPDRVAGEGWDAFASKQQPVTPPGARGEYTNEGVQLLSPVLERAAGVPLWQFARDRLFVPIGAVHTEMRRDEKGSTNTFADAKTTLREFARLGELARRGGAWPGKGQVVPALWIEAMTTPCPQARDYGFLWWLGDRPRVWAMKGYLDTCVWVFPDSGIVVARAQSKAYLHATEPFDAKAMCELLAGACR
jgi:CubicO group peptidase (beta-lactamase class C family)